MKVFIVSVLFFTALLTKACPVNINVTDLLGNPQPDITILLDNIPSGKTNNQGHVAFLLKDGAYTLQLSYQQFIIDVKNIEVNCNGNNLFQFVIDTTRKRTKQLKEITVTGVTQTKKINQSPLSVQAIDLSKLYGKGGDVGEVLNRALGVKLRSDGNIGAPVQINLGGLQGKAIRLFKDGIPIELFGHGFSLGTIPVNMLERIEIYKGVMPLHLASDALGGGVNLVSREERKKFAEVSYEFGSFNTHRATANILWQNKSGKFYNGLNSSYNYSDNNYKVSAPFYDAQTSVTTYKNTKRFHDATKAVYAEGFIGIRNRKWADDLRVTLITSRFYKEIQHDAEMNKVYGEPYSKEKNYTGLINYKKAFIDNRLKVNVLGAYSYFDTRFIDTATVRYGWDGEIIGRNLKPGEINLGNNQHLKYHFFSSRLHVSYQLTNNHTIDFSHLYYQQQRKGSDPLGAISAIERIDVLTVPAKYRKDNMALGLRSTWLDQSMESIVAVKYYHFNTNGYTTDNFGLGWKSTSSGRQPGFLGGLRWSKNRFLAKVSYEYASRLPDEYEIFGDARLVKENMELQPEKSHNINLNGEYSWKEKDKTFNLSAGLFYRKVRDIIFLQLDIPFSRFINYERAEVKGFEIEASYQPAKYIDGGVNLTYQDIRRVQIQEAMFRNLEGSRIPNVPFLFSNFWLNTRIGNVLSKGDEVQFGWNANYTHRFFLHAIPKNQEPKLFDKVSDFQTSLIIPRDGRLGQFGNNVGVYYHFTGGKIIISGECRNIGNAKLYDNFNVQKPGSSFHIKLVYQFF